MGTQKENNIPEWGEGVYELGTRPWLRQEGRRLRDGRAEGPAPRDLNRGIL